MGYRGEYLESQRLHILALPADSALGALESDVNISVKSMVTNMFKCKKVLTLLLSVLYF